MSAENQSVEDWEPFADLLDEGGIPVFGFRLVSFLDSEGQPSMSWQREGEVTGGRALGDIIGAAFELFHDHMHDAGGQPE